MNFLKIGDFLVNLDQVGSLCLDYETGDSAHSVVFFLGPQEDSCELTFCGPEAEAIRAYFRGEGGRFVRTGVWEVDVPKEATDGPQ